MAADLRVFARLGFSPYGRPLLSSSGPWAATRASSARIHCFRDQKLVEIMCFPEEITALEVRPWLSSDSGGGASDTSAYCLVAYSLGGRLWARQLLVPEKDSGAAGGSKRSHPARHQGREEEQEDAMEDVEEKENGGKENAEAIPHRPSKANKRPSSPQQEQQQDQQMMEAAAAAAEASGAEDASKGQPTAEGHLEAEMLQLTVTEQQELAALTIVPKAEGVCLPGALGPDHGCLALQVCWGSLLCCSDAAPKDDPRPLDAPPLSAAAAALPPATATTRAGSRSWAPCVRGECLRGLECPAAAARAALSCRPARTTSSLLLTTAVDPYAKRNRSDDRDCFDDERSQMSQQAAAEVPQDASAAAARSSTRGTPVLPELFAAIPAVTCDGLPPSYLLTGDDHGFVWAHGAPGTPLGPPGVLVADLKQPIVALLAARLFHKDTDSAVADTVVVVGAAGRAVALAAEPSAPSAAEPRHRQQQQEEEAGLPGKRGSSVVLRDWRLHSPLTSAAAVGPMLLYASAGRLYAADMSADLGTTGGKGASPSSQRHLRPRLLQCREPPLLLSAAPRAPSGSHVALLGASGALGELKVDREAAAEGAEGGGLPPGTSPAALQEQLKGLLSSLKDAEAMEKPLKERARVHREQLAVLGPSLQLLRDTPAGEGLSVSICPKQVMDGSSSSNGMVSLEVYVSVENRSKHNLPSSWHLLISSVSSCAGGRTPRGAVQVPLPRIGPGHSASLSARLQVSDWRGSGLLRAYLCARSPREQKQQQEQQHPRYECSHSASGSPVCALLVESPLDDLDLGPHAAATALSSIRSNAVTTVGRRAGVGTAKDRHLEKLRLRVVSSGHPAATREGTAIGKGPLRPHGTSTGHRDFMQDLLGSGEKIQVGGGRCSSSISARPCEGRPAEWQVEVGGETMPALLRAHGCVLARIIRWSPTEGPHLRRLLSLPGTDKDAPQGSSQGENSRHGDLHPGAAPHDNEAEGRDAEEEAEAAARDEQKLVSLRAVERQLKVLRDALGGIKKLKALGSDGAFHDRYADLVPVLQDRALLLQEGIVDTLFKLRSTHDLTVNM